MFAVKQMIAKTELEKLKKRKNEKTYLAGRNILWEKCVFSFFVFFNILVFFSAVLATRCIPLAKSG